MESSAMKEIQSIYGMEEFKLLAMKLKQVADNQRKLSGARIQLPNYLFAVAPGCGVTTRIRQFSRLLDELHLIRYEGDRKYFEWMLDDSAFKNGGNFDRLLDQIRFVAGFRRNFYGIIGVDVDAWVEHADSPELMRLVDFAEDMMGQILIVFIVALREESKLQPIIRRISHEMPLEVIRIAMPGIEELVQCLSDFLKQRGFIVRSSAKEYFQRIMPQLIRSKQFDGFQSLDNLADEIVYHYCSGEITDSVYLTEKDVCFIEENGGYIERLTAKGNTGNEETRRIGFGNGRDF